MNNIEKLKAERLSYLEEIAAIFFEAKVTVDGDRLYFKVEDVQGSRAQELLDKVKNGDRI